MTIEKVNQLRELVKKMRLDNRRSWILMVPNSIGEVAIVCGFAKAFTETHGHGITLVTTDVHKNIASFYPGRFNAAFTMPMELMRDLSNYGVIHPNDFILDTPFNTWPEQSGDGRLYEIHTLLASGQGRGGLSLLDMYRYVLRLDWNAPVEKGLINPELRSAALKYCEDHGITEGKSVILFPGSNTNKPASGLFWETLSDSYRSAGLDVYVNYAGAALRPDVKSELGTELALPIDLAIAVSEYAGNIVTASSGLPTLALMVGLQCNINVILPNQSWTNALNNFKPINSILGSNLLVIPEVALNHESYYEWDVQSDAHQSVFEEIANSIVNKLPHQTRIDRDNISLHSNVIHKNWAQDLVRDWS